MESLRGTREAGKDSLDSLRGTREAGKDHLDSLRGTREAPGFFFARVRALCAPRGTSHLEGTREVGRHQGTREAGKDQLPIESRFWKGAGFCITFNTISMAIGPVRGKSWGRLHGWLPVAQTGL